LYLIEETSVSIGNVPISLSITGSAGMGVSEKLKIPFVQELIASAEYTSNFHPEAKTLIDIGGEDSKIIFFNENTGLDLRMNGSCAGGTGAFIDQMATLMNISHTDLNDLAHNSREIHSIASRCGVFAKTDVQNLLAREIPKPDIAASIFHAVALQIKNSLLRSCDAHPKVLYSGGPLSFLPELKKAVTKLFGFNDSDLILADNSELIPAIGAALSANFDKYNTTIDEYLNVLRKAQNLKKTFTNGIAPLFTDKTEMITWTEKRSSVKAPRIHLRELDNKECFLGIDSGSTTTKIVLTDKDGKIAFDFYRNNESNPIGTVTKGLTLLKNLADDLNINLKITSSAVTGYGEDLIHSAFDLDFGIVETIAHYRAAKTFDENISFILDIGGQDMKAIFVKDGLIRNIEINEACSSGCGSFIESFANSLDYTVDKFANLALNSTRPCNLGTRCTVFMNSKVKQSFREGASIEDISAGLAYSVINNCLHKVLKVTDHNLLGDHIIVQGGTFRNSAIHKAFENVLGKKVICPDISGLMGAYGAALVAKDNYYNNQICEGSLRTLTELDSKGKYNIKYIHCKACENVCTVSKLNFGNGNVFYTGNRCENIYTNHGKKLEKGFNLLGYKYDLLFDRELTPDTKPIATIGIPRVLNLYENFPYWSKLFVECGIEVHISDKSTPELCDTGAGTVMSDNICFPAKLAHGHILNLINSGVDRIFFPIVTYEKDEIPGTSNCYNCPVVTGYPTLIKSTINPEKNYSVKFDTPNITFKDEKLLKEASFEYLKQFGVTKKIFNKAFALAMQEQENYRKAIKEKGTEIIQKAKEDNKKLIVFAGRPYHIDPFINHNIPDIITDFGLSIISEDCITYDEEQNLTDLNVLSQWAYPNRVYRAAKWAGIHDNVEFIQLNNFGCGPDTITIDETKEILESYQKNYTLIRIDELTSTGSLKLRIRSLIESIKANEKKSRRITFIKRETTRDFGTEDKDRLILIPFFSKFHSNYVSASFASMGYKTELLPPSDQKSVDLGLKYCNNEICYPATLVIGDLLKALKSGNYDLSKIAVAITQTGGQCRASNYLSLIRKSLVKNGFKDVPVVGVSVSNKLLNHQPGFKLGRKRLTVQGILGILFGDAISKMYYSIAAREKNKGDALKIADKYNALAQGGIEKRDLKYLISTLKNAITEFNDIEIQNEIVPKIGVVGEVYVKYNPMGNQNIVNDLASHGIEVVMPPLINIFVQWFINIHYKHNLKIESKPIAKRLAFILEKYYGSIFNKFEKAMTAFRYNCPSHHIKDLAKKAEKVMNMANHYFGEGWLIAGDILAFTEDNIYNVLCLQPFGCIANHIIARGIEKSLKEIEPKLNILYLDIDAGNSEVNLHNRLHLLVRRAKEEIVSS
jgi:predicted CoA-substrate-specific enzyme activase